MSLDADIYGGGFETETMGDVFKMEWQNLFSKSKRAMVDCSSEEYEDGWADFLLKQVGGFIFSFSPTHIQNIR